MKIDLMEIIEIKIQIRQLEEQINDLIKRIFPKGSEIKWQHGRHIQTGTVTDVGHYGNIHVLNDKTGNNVRIDIFNVFEAHGLVDVLFPKLRQQRPEKTGAVQEDTDGIIDNVKVYDRALSAEEIADEFQTGNGEL